MKRIALVTGASRGIGRTTVEALAEGGFDVVGAARDPADVPRAARGFALDVTDDASVAAFARRVADELGGWHVLVNNAGVALDGFDAKVARRTLDVNLRGPIRVTGALRAHALEGAVIVNVSSGIGELSCLRPPLRARYASGELSEADLLELADRFVAEVADGTHAAAGWPSSAYAVSKVSLNAWTRWLAAELGDRARVNAVCPGWVRTDMGGPHASRGVDEGAASVVWAATLGPDGPTGGFFRDGARIEF
ncbi:MAG: SDR family NAD(P)-dependent oxidoreductase [Sandaracinaceae bacterium]|nr:SDR family NAD(P)-dependent oxidoreductase [Sandaracinaceae bacterium]